MIVKQVIGFQSEIAKLMHQRHLAFMERTDERARHFLVEKMGADCPENLKASYRVLNQAFENENEAFKSQRGSDLTAQIKSIDSARDTTLSGIRGMLDALSKIGSDEQKAAAPKLSKLFELYKVKTTDSYEDQGIKLSQICSDYKASLDLQEAAQSCGLVSQFATLKAQNDECRKLVNARNRERAQTDNQAMNKARKETDGIYADFIQLLNAYAITTCANGLSPYDELIDVLNSDIDYYKSWVLRKTVSEEEQPQTQAPQEPAPQEEQPEAAKEETPEAPKE